MTGRRQTVSSEAMRRFGAAVDFGKTASDYARHRAGFPPAFFDLLEKRGYVRRGDLALDLGTGTGTIARGLAQVGLRVTGIDPADALLAEAAALDRTAGVEVTYRTGTAESTGSEAGSADLITAGQCWHWFDRPRAAAEAARVLRPGGRLVIAHFDWLPLSGNVVEATEQLILDHNPEWAGAGGAGIYPDWLADMAEAGFTGLETASFDISQPYSHSAWRGRIRASAGIAASLSEPETARFDRALAEMLAHDFPNDPLYIPHRVWLASGVTPNR